MMVLGMLPAAALAADGETEHVHGQAGWVGETYYTGVCEYTEGETVKSETPDLCDGAFNTHEHTEECYAGEETPDACTGELNAHEHTDACYSMTQTEGTWTCETGEPPVEEPKDEEPAVETKEEPTNELDTMSAEPMTYTISGAKAYKVTERRGTIPEFSFEGIPGSRIDPKDLPAGPVLYQYNGNDWYYIYTGKIMGTGAHLGYTIDYLMLGENGEVTAHVKDALIDKTDEISELRFFYEYAFAFPDLGSEGVTVMYSIDGGPLKETDPAEPLIFSQDEVKKIGTIAFFVKAEQGYFPVDSFSQTSGDQKGILSRLDDPESTLGSAFNGIKAEALAQGFTHEFHYSQFKSGEFSDQGTRGYKLNGEADAADYTITYHANAPQGVQASGSTAAQSGTWNTRFEIAKNGFTAPGYKFQNWNTAADGSGVSYNPGYSYTIMGKNVDLYAQWEPAPRTQTDAKFFVRTDGLIPMENGNTFYGSALYLPTNVTDKKDPNYQNSMLWGKIYDRVVWTDYEGVVTDGKINGVKLAEAFASVSAAIAELPDAGKLVKTLNPENGKMTFDPETQDVAWYVIKTIAGDADHVDGVVYDKNARYVLQYIANAGDDVVDGLPGAKLYPEDSEADLTYGAVTRKGYEFLGWSEDQNAQTPTYTSGDHKTITMDSDKYLYAVWEKKPDNQINIHYYVESYNGSGQYVSVNPAAPDTDTIQFNETKKAETYAGADWAGKHVDLSHYTYDPDVTAANRYSSVTYNRLGMTENERLLKLFFRADKTIEEPKYTVTVNFLEDGTTNVLQPAYVSEPMKTGKEYNVLEQIPATIDKDNVTYTRHHTVDGNDIANTIRDHDVTINVYYKADRDFKVEYYLETAYNAGTYELSSKHKGQGTFAWNVERVTSGDYAIPITGYTYDEDNANNVKEVKYADEARTLKLYYKMNAPVPPVDPGHYTVVYTDGTGLAGYNVSFTRTVGETYAPYTDNTTTKFVRQGYDFASWQLRAGSTVHGEGDKLYGDKDAVIYYDAQWTARTYHLGVTKTVSGHSLPESFAIVITDKDGKTVQELTPAGAVEENGVYVWRTELLTFGETYTFTERDTAVTGYNLTASVQIMTGANESGPLYQTVNGTAAELTFQSLAVTDGTAVAFTNSYSPIQTGGDPGPGSDYSYYRVTVRYLDRADGKELADEYRTDRIREGRTYDVTGNIPAALTADGVAYSHSSTEGAATGTIRGNVIVTAWYTAEPDNGGTMDIPDNEVPQGDQPVTPPADQPDGTVPGDGTDGGEEIDIEDGNVPQGSLPTGGDETTGQSDGGDGIVIIDGDTPMGNLPQTGTMAQQTDPTRTLGMLALALSLAAAGLAVTIGRKKEDEA